MASEHPICAVVKQHDDGDLTLDCQGTAFVVTTEGQVFIEVPRTLAGMLLKSLLEVEDNARRQESV